MTNYRMTAWTANSDILCKMIFSVFLCVAAFATLSQPAQFLYQIPQR